MNRIRALVNRLLQLKLGRRALLHPRQAGPLATRHNQLGLLVNSVQEYGIFTLDTVGKVVTWNKGAARLYGYSAGEIIGRHFSLFYPPDVVADRWPQHELQIAAREERFEDEGWRIRKDGSRFWVNAIVTAIHNERGELLGFGKVTRDLTERRAAEEELRAAAGRLQAIVETAVDGIITIDERGKIETVNAATERLFGYRAKEMIGRNITMLMPQPYRAEHDSYLHRYRRTGERRIIGIGREVSGRRKDGTEFPLDLAVSETQLPGRRFFTGILRDITARTREEEELRKAKEAAEAANRVRDQFMAIMSHELRTPLNAIVGYADILDARVHGPLTPKQEGAVARINTSSQHLLALIDQVLTFSRNLSVAPQPRIENVAAAAVITEAAALAEPLAAKKQLAFHVELPEAEASVETDPGMLRQILVNLLGNAVKYTDAGAINVQASIDNDYFRVEVRDTGCGIAPEHLERIWEPFWQADQSFTRRNEGAGLGLSVTRRLVEALGGSVHVSSDVSRGSTFTVVLPTRLSGARRAAV